MRNTKWILIWVMVVITVPILAQEDIPLGSKVTIVMNNGSQISGELVSKTELEIRIRKGEEVTSIPMSNVSYVSYTDENTMSIQGALQDRYYLFSSAMPMDKGDIYYRNLNVFINTFSFGVTSNFSVAGGIETISLIAGEFPTFIIAPKFNVPVAKNFHLGVTSVSYLRDDFFISTVFGNGTFGNTSNNVSLGVGFGVDGVESTSSAFYTLSGIVKLSNKVSLMGEFISIDAFNDFFSNFFNINARIKFKGDVFFDIGFMRVNEFGDQSLLPTVGVAAPIKKSIK